MRELFATLARRAGAAAQPPAFDDGTTRLDYGGLARRTAALSDRLVRLPTAPQVIGLLGGQHVDWIAAQLAIWHAGRTAVPLPSFFRAPQLAHILRDAGVAHLVVTPDTVPVARDLGIPFTIAGPAEASFSVPGPTEARQIVYTSGSTGRPKGVVLSTRQILWSARALAAAIDAHAGDSYLSVLPIALLLETTCAILVPILTGAAVRLEPALAAAFDGADGTALAAAIADRRPSCLVLVPQLLARWLEALEESNARAPSSLRFVAVGGAAVSPTLSKAAWARGIPVHEGYGLSECGSVVALNRPGERAPGTAGRPLSGLDVAIDDGEIVVRGPSVMDRYLHGEPVDGAWRTGDLGEFDADGNLIVRGRLDNLIITPVGRNVSPEWIEALLAVDPRIAVAAVAHLEGPHLMAALVPSARGEDWFAQATLEEIGALVDSCCRDVPAYAVPRQFVVVPAGEPARFGGLGRKLLLDACAAALRTRDTAHPAAQERVIG